MSGTTEKVEEGALGAWGAPMRGPLTGQRVLDFSRSLAGPYATQILADMGATVLKVEDVRGGDSTRVGGPFHKSDVSRRQSGYFHSVNRNKRGLAIDLKSPEGRELVLRLVDNCDIVVENFRVGVMDRLGLSYEALSARNERLIYAALRGFGDPRSGESAYVNWPAFDVVAQAMGGICGVTGAEGGEPTKVGPGVGDIVPGMFLAMGIMAAVIERHATGKGQFVDVAMTDSILAISERIVYQKSFGGMVAGQVGNHQPYAAPFGLFPTSDGYIAIGAPQDHFFRQLALGLEAPELLEDPRFATQQQRTQERIALIEELSRHTARFPKAELRERLGGVIPLGPVYTMADIESDPHFQIRGMLPTLDLPGVEEPLAVAGSPIHFSNTPRQPYRRGPALGEDTDAVLGALGYSPQERDALREAGVVA